MHWRYFLAVAALTSLTSTMIAGDVGSIPSTLTGGRSKVVRLPPEAFRCGPNALYMLLKAHDRAISSSEFFRQVDSGDRGLSLAELRDLCARYSLPAEVRSCTYEQLLKACRLPLIALVHPRLDTGNLNDGHYVLVVDADADGVTLIDGTSGEEYRSTRDKFCHIWQGYVVVQVGGQTDWWLLLGISAAGWALIAWLILRSNCCGIRPKRFTEEGIPTEAIRSDSLLQSCRNGERWFGRVVAMLALLFLGQTDAEASSAPGDDFACWRCPERDGVNCLYLQLRLLGYTGTYEEVVAAVPGGAEQASLSGLAQAARRLGFVLVPAKLTVAELDNLRLPTVILFEETEFGRGRFHLLVELLPSEAGLVDGAFITLSIERMSIDRFRRGWTGFALVPQLTSQWPRRVFLMASGALLAGTGIWLARRITGKLLQRTSISPGEITTSEIV